MIGFRASGIGVKSAFLLVVAGFLLCATPVDALAKSRSKAKKTHSRPRAARTAAAPVDRGARYADLVIEADTGRILRETNSGALRHPASLTKMMTLYLAFQAVEHGVIRLDSELPVSAKAAAQSPSKLGLRAGQMVRAYDAIMGLVTESANDAAVVLAEALGGSTDRFADMMVSQARTLGMRSTVFRNPNGLPDPEQVTTARDMAILGHALIYHYPGFYGYFGRTHFVYKGRTYNNHNHLMKRYGGMDGIKTGYIRASGFNLVASATRGQTRLIGVVFGGSSAVSRDNLMAQLLDYGFAQAARPREAQENYVSLPSKVATAFGGRPRHVGQPGGADQSLRVSANEAEAPSAPPEQAVSEPAADQRVRSGSWGVQIGAFGNVDSAQQYLTSMGKTLEPLLGNAEPSLQKVTLTDGSSLYRARFMGVEQKTAREACSYMIRRGQNCHVVSTGP